MTIVVAIVAGGLGALARHEATETIRRRTGSARPWGTAAVNLVGAALLGTLLAMHGAGHLGSGVPMIAVTGFAGGFTTFSTWMVDAVDLGRRATDRSVRVAALHVVGMFAAGILAMAGTDWLIRG